MIGLLVNVDVEDLERAVEFYRDAFDLRVSRRFGSDAVEMLGASSPIYLLAKPPGSTASRVVPLTRDYRRHWTPVHLDFVVEDVAGVVQKAQAAGASLEEDIQSHRWGRLALMADPFGNGFCVVQFVGRGYDEIAD